MSRKSYGEKVTCDNALRFPRGSTYDPYTYIYIYIYMIYMEVIMMQLLCTSLYSSGCVWVSIFSHTST